MPTTKVGIPAVAAADTAFSAPRSSAAFTLFPLAQLGSPSVASSMYFGFGSVRP